MAESLDPARLRAFLISLDEQDSVILDIQKNKKQPHVSMPQNRVIGDLFGDIEAYAPGLVRQFEAHGDPSGIRSQLRLARNSVQTKITELTLSKDPFGMSEATDKRRVFVVHGRNAKARDAMFAFLRSIDLNPIEWEEAIQMTDETSPYIGHVLDIAFANSQAAVVMLTGDDVACLGAQYRTPHDLDYEKRLTAQARPNVLFKLGMAFGKYPTRTVIVEFGHTRPFTDVIGRNTIHFHDDSASRHKLAARLRNAKCLVNTDHKSDWLSEGNFSAAFDAPQHEPSLDCDAKDSRVQELESQAEDLRRQVREANAERERLEKESADWKKQWEDERGGSSARDEKIKQREETIEALEKRLAEMKNRMVKSPDHLLTIHSAEWIPKEHGKPKRVDRFLRQHVNEVMVDALSLKLNNANLGGDPEPDTHKVLKLSYSYGSDGPHQVTKDEYDWLVLPPKAQILPEPLPEDIKKMWQWVGLVRNMAHIAEVLNVRLEAVWHQWNNTNEKLIYPLSSASIPDLDAPLSWNLRQLLEFRILYRIHLEEVKLVCPDFESNVTIEGFPSDSQYLAVRHNLDNHWRLLLEHADSKIKLQSQSAAT